ncbi:DUF6438 domain-containing protein [Portibacter lacus]|uniref:DUF6438 domain-containing protein n=1 Tax=Portibacter lacus TaxID=1099794 RepID=A0AA37WC27_9BACT|nr:DUF6438 domain-containing protein [Portibacter lacus]GLR16061.1 hypothetical protein GCM10007940_06760 [Portibacter lacus]
MGILNSFISKWTLLIGSVLILTSCGTTKAVKQVMESYDFGIKKVHVENVNSSYDRLVPDYYESLKSSDQKFAEKIAKDTMLYMQKGACLGKCPVFRITIFNNGIVKYEGVKNVDLVGIYESKLKKEQQEKARSLIDAIDLPRMYSKYPRGITMSKDVAITKMVLSDGVLKFPTVISYDQPQELTNIEVYLNQLIKDLSWVQI